MNDPDSTSTERLLGRVLTIGTRTSSVLLVAGLVTALTVTQATRLSSLLLQIGLLVLMATPVLRVVVSVGAFAARREWAFVFLTSVVLVLLIASIWLALTA
jgi:uncharacterized membrane protein